MFQTDQPTAVSSIPTPAAAGTPGFFTGGNPGAGQPATIVDNDWLNMIQSELMNVVTAGGLMPSKTTYNQVITAIRSMFGSAVGSSQNSRMYVSAASASSTYTADELIVETNLGGQTYRLASINQAINLASVGANGMDVGAAPVNGYVAIYAIYNPTTSTTALLGTSANAAVGNVYGGAHMPSGFTASALIAVLPTNASSQIKPSFLRNRRVSILGANVLTTSTQAASITTLSVAGVLPPNATSTRGSVSANSTVAGSMGLNIFSEAAAGGLGGQQTSTGAVGGISASFDIDIVNAQNIYYVATAAAGTPSFSIALSSYTF